MDLVAGRRLRWAISSCFVLAVVALVAIALTGRSAAAGVSVEAGNDYFCSQAFDGSVCETDITAGDMVTWNVVAGSHTVTECSSGFAACPPAGGFDSGILVDGQTFAHTFDTPGTYAYRCELHTSEMLGKIVVGAPTATPTPSPTPTTSPTVESTTAPTEALTPAPTIAVLPNTGGATTDGRASAWPYLLLASGMALLGAAAVAISAARKE